MTVLLTLIFGCVSEPNPDISTATEHGVGERVFRDKRVEQTWPTCDEIELQFGVAS